MVMTMKNAVFWDMTLCSLVETYQLLGATYYLNLFGRNQDMIYGQVNAAQHYSEPTEDGTKRCIDQNKCKTLRRNPVRRKRSEKGIIQFHSKISLMQLARDWTGARISGSIHTDLSSYRQFLVTAPILGLYNSSAEVFLFGYHIHFLVQYHESPCVCFLQPTWLKKTEGDERSGDTTTADIHTLLDAILNMSLRSASFTYEAFFLC